MTLSGVGLCMIYFKGACFDQLLHPFPKLLISCAGLYSNVNLLYVHSIYCVEKSNKL